MNVITNTFVGLKCLRKIKIQIFYDHVDHIGFHIVIGMSNGSTFVGLHCWTNNVRQFDPSLTSNLPRKHNMLFQRSPQNFGTIALNLHNSGLMTSCANHQSFSPANKDLGNQRDRID